MSKILFLHPDLGIGGAERLVVDAALALKSRGHDVNIVTTHHDKNHAFEETVDGTLSVTVVGDWIPRSICYKFYAVMAYIRMIYAALYVIILSNFKSDVVFCDLVSAAIPILKIRIKYVIFYCHFPDQLLSQQGGFLKAIYRAPINWLEEITTKQATRIFVNSKFTAKVFRETFKRINVQPEILYPSLNMSFFDSYTSDTHLPKSLDGIILEDTLVFLSINRYERKKNLQLALEAFSHLKNLLDDTLWKRVHLIITGGYDLRVTENVEYYQELVEINENLNLEGKVSFLKSMTDSEKIHLLKKCTCLLYTPSNEHFGIVPIEAMYMGKPVIAVNSGGPTETIVDGKTGYLCPSEPEAFAEAMKKFAESVASVREFGANGRKRVISLFSFDQFSSKLNETINALLDKKKS